ncbi:unnamed protein product [Echinostoma caproni]|uniref:Uncharacterized protein n=1 Tax=Echinostoma caproni TaxID=27848 RepID=A0A183A9L3_9TREM|nr:unnamed protein product [Echinostoma caproni]
MTTIVSFPSHTESHCLVPDTNNNNNSSNNTRLKRDSSPTKLHASRAMVQWSNLVSGSTAHSTTHLISSRGATITTKSAEQTTNNSESDCEMNAETRTHNPEEDNYAREDRDLTRGTELPDPRATKSFLISNLLGSQTKCDPSSVKCGK